MPNGTGKELNAQLFIEGRQVPFSSINTNYQAGQPCSASIQMVPLRELNDVLPRTMVHVFVKDFSAPGTFKPWVLLFEGEIYGFGARKGLYDRSTTLFCMGLSNYWDNAKQYYMNLKSTISGPLDLMNSLETIGNAKRDQIALAIQAAEPTAYLTSLVNSSLEGGNDFLTAVTEIVKGIKNINSLFKYADARYRINDRIVFKSSGDISQLIDFKNKSALIDQLTGSGNGGIMTIRQIINTLMSLIFHDFVSVPAPSKVNVSIADSFLEVLESTGETLVTATPGEDITTSSRNTGIGKDKTQTIGSFIFKPNTFILPPPKCNVLFPDQYQSLDFQRNFFHEVTRFKLQPSLTSLERVAGFTQTFKETVYAPNGFNEYQTGKDTTENKNQGQQFGSPDGQGNYGDDSKNVTENSNTLQECHFLSYEEILKGIFSDQGNTIPSAQIFAKTGPFKDNNKYYQRGADFLFHKKRLASRNFTTSGPLNLAPVPGFPMLVLDDSEAEQHIVGQLMSIQHSISAYEGGQTQYSLGFSRFVEEKDLWSGKSYEPPIPPWYDSTVFGERRVVKPEDSSVLPKSQRSRVAGLGELNDYGNTTLTDYYEGLLGLSKKSSHQGSVPLTSKKYPGLVAATLNMLNQYRAAKKTDRLDRFISLQTRRDYVELEENFEFLGADNSRFKKKGKTSPSKYKDLSGVVFKGGTFDGDFVNTATNLNSRDEFLKELFGKAATEKRRTPIDAYRNKLTKNRGFRG